MDLHIGGKQHCYTVPECSIDDENYDSSSSNSDSDTMTPTSLIPSTIGAFHTNDGRPPQLGYFVPLSMYYLSPQTERKTM